MSVLSAAGLQHPRTAWRDFSRWVEQNTDRIREEAEATSRVALAVHELPAVVLVAAEERAGVERERARHRGFVRGTEGSGRHGVGERLERDAVDPDEPRIEAQAAGVDRDRRVVAEQAPQAVQRSRMSATRFRPFRARWTTPASSSTSMRGARPSSMMITAWERRASTTQRSNSSRSLMRR